ncbi:hypothetical protein D3C76_1663100 [compost metagenome]
MPDRKLNAPRRLSFSLTSVFFSFSLTIEADAVKRVIKTAREIRPGTYHSNSFIGSFSSRKFSEIEEGRLTFAVLTPCLTMTSATITAAVVYREFPMLP